VGFKNSISDLFKLGETKDAVIKLVEAKFELKKLEIQEKAERGISELIFTLGLVIFSSVVLVFVLQIVAYCLNLWLGEPYGLLSVLGFLIILIALVYSERDKIKDKIKNTIQKEMDAMDS
jgi:uncharacterized membrane protein YqjE